MTRLRRAIRFSCAYPTVTILAAAALLATCGGATASPGSVAAMQNADLVAGGAAGEGSVTPDAAATEQSAVIAAPSAVTPSPQVDLLAAPSTETPLHHFYCVEYARLRSGLQIFGDAKTWWKHGKHLYAEFTQPAADAVMVFAGSRRIRRGHVAFVTQIVSPREIRVDQANWQNHGEIDRYTPVLDVSANNDWSKVRVWDMRSGQFGTRVYAITGFIAGALASREQASADLAPQAATLAPMPQSQQ